MVKKQLDLQADPRTLVSLIAIPFNSWAASGSFTWLVASHSKPGVVGHACNLITQETEAERL